MLLPHGTTVAVLDGTKMHLFHNTGSAGATKLSPLPEPAIGSENKGSGSRHQSSSANPDESRLGEDNFAAASAEWLNRQALGGKIDNLFVIATPKTLGELRKHYHKVLQGKLLGEVAKDLTGHSAADIEAAVDKA